MGGHILDPSDGIGESRDEWGDEIRLRAQGSRLKQELSDPNRGAEISRLFLEP
jgi:hypothetical protein